MPVPINPLAPHLTGELSEELLSAIAAGSRHESPLSAFACADTDVIRRDPARDIADAGFRPSFVRDTEKIIHLPAYNRLAGKTQVFSLVAHDDLSRRGLHVQLVARIARDIGRALGLNCDLIEAIGLGHDIGHTPFGHAGERFLSEVRKERADRYFFHNVQSVRVLDTLAARNISLQVLDGALAHNGEFEQQVLRVSPEVSFAALDSQVAACLSQGQSAVERICPMTLEGCVVRISDIIAYVGRDRQDAIMAGLCTEESFDDGLGGAYNSWALKVFAADVIEHSFGKDHLKMSEEAFSEMSRAKAENYKKIYLAEAVSGMFGDQVRELFYLLYDLCMDALRFGDESAEIFRHHIALCEQRALYYGRHYAWEDDPDACVVDFISSMTDRYFVKICCEHFAEAHRVFE